MSSVYAAILDNIPQPIVVVTPTGVVMYRNKPFERAFGLEADDWLRNAALSLGGEPGWLKAVFDTMSEMDAVEVEFNNRLYRVQNILSGAVDPNSAALMFEDVTREAEKEQSKSDFTSMVVHDLRGPLSGIQATLEFVVSEAARFSAMHEDLLKEASSESSRMMSLINEILDFSRIQAGKYTVEYEPVRLGGMLKRAALSMQAVAVRNEVLLVSAHSANLPTIQGSLEKLTQSLINLISNALKFTPKGGLVTIGCHVEPDVHRPENVVISVTDTGVGMTDQELEKLFQRYEQTSSKPLRGESGTGLGLYIVKEIVEAHGGTLEVSSVQGVGTSMLARLPVRQPRPAA
jgi:signal transduction histidine kinase